MKIFTPALKPGQHVRVVQTAIAREGPWQISVEGVVLSCERQPTGSWFAGLPEDRLWLQRLRLRKDDGEIVDLVLDAGSVVTIFQPAGAGGPSAGGW